MYQGEVTTYMYMYTYVQIIGQHFWQLQAHVHVHVQITLYFTGYLHMYTITYNK